MPLFWVSTLDTEKQEFLGAVFVNRASEVAAAAAAIGMVSAARADVTKVEAFAAEIPAGAPGIPYDAIGRLVSYEELAGMFPDVRAVEVESDENGRIVNITEVDDA